MRQFEDPNTLPWVLEKIFSPLQENDYHQITAFDSNGNRVMAIRLVNTSELPNEVGQHIVDLHNKSLEK